MKNDLGEKKQKTTKKKTEELYICTRDSATATPTDDAKCPKWPLADRAPCRQARASCRRQKVILARAYVIVLL